MAASASARVSNRPRAAAHGRQLRGELKDIAAVRDQPVIEKILTHASDCFEAMNSG